jgi:TonB family protein
MRRYRVIVLLFLSLPGQGVAQNILRPALAAAQAPPSTLPTYEDSPSGLKHLINDAMKAAKAKDQGQLAALTSSMVMPDPAAWFSRVFGPAIGEVYSESYARNSHTLAEALARSIQDLQTQEFGVFEVTRFTKPCDSKADELEYPLLLSRQEPEPLSEITFQRDSLSRSLRFFVYVDGAFRFAGDLAPYPKVPKKPNGTQNSESGSDAKSNSAKTGANVQAAHLVKQVPPVYPSQAKRELIQGEVVLHALIGRDGATTVLGVNKGRCVLAQPAIEAVRQWRYTPTMINGSPVEVDTNITVNFALHSK